MGDRTRASEPTEPDPLARRFEAVVLISAGPGEWLELGALVRELHDAALPVLHVELNGVGGPGRHHEPATRFRESSAALDALWRRGVDPGSVLVVVGADAEATFVDDALPADLVVVRVDHQGRRAGRGTVHVEGGPDRVLALLVDQHERRRRGELPDPAPAPGWALTIDGFDPEQERVRASLLTLADGYVGWRGVPSVGHPSSPPLVVHSGIYDDGDGIETRLFEGPVPTSLSGHLDGDGSLRRVLDLRAGLLHEHLTNGAMSVRSIRFSPLTRRGLLVHRVQVHPHDSALPTRLLDAASTNVLAARANGDGSEWIQAGGVPGGMMAAARAIERVGSDGAVRTQLTAWAAAPDSTPPVEHAVDRLPDAHPMLFDRLLEEHRAAWANRWADADVVVEGDDELQLAVRFALFHLMGAAADDGEAAVGARGLTGSGYRGHVFWDADSFTLPFLAATHPESARAMLEYRLRRLPAALDAAREVGRRGARFPWESARTGRDVTPPSARDRSGRLVPIRTGRLEDHIVADVAWAARCYVDWTGDDAFARGAGLPLFVETARYWASRIRVESDGLAHIYGVIGPDEYHEPVDDNSYTNVMARWNLREAAMLTAPTGSGSDDAPVSADERARWLELADALIDGYDPDTGLYEQCAGFYGLEPLIAAEAMPRRPIAADLLLGSARVRASQVIKQADVLMLHHLVPDEVVPGTLEANLRFYEPRTAHGSSLSPAIHASLFARARHYEQALEALRIASRIDLDDLTGSTAGGLHIATMGGLWQAMVWGFAGVRPSAGQLAVDPRLPRGWAALEVNVRYRGSRVSVRREGPSLHVRADPGAQVRIDGSSYAIDSQGLWFTRRRHTWELDR